MWVILPEIVLIPRVQFCTEMYALRPAHITFLLTCLSYCWTSKAPLSVNRCLRHKQTELISKPNPITVHEKSNLVPILKNILGIKRKLQKFDLTKQNSYVCTYSTACLSSKFIDLTSVNTTQVTATLLIDGFLILSQDGGYCIIQGKFYTLVKCKEAITAIASLL